MSSGHRLGPPPRLRLPLVLQLSSAATPQGWRAQEGEHHVWQTSCAHAVVFPVVMYGCANWTIKKADHRIIDAFELWCWKRLLRIPWTARQSNQSILKEISPEYSFEGLMLKLKLQYFGYLMRRADSFRP